LHNLKVFMSRKLNNLLAKYCQVKDIFFLREHSVLLGEFGEDNDNVFIC